MAIVNNLEGFLEDCGCAGDSVGGVARIITAVRQVEAARAYVILCGESATKQGDRESYFIKLREARSQLAIPLYWIEQDYSGAAKVQPEEQVEILREDLLAAGIALRVASDSAVSVNLEGGAPLCGSNGLKSRGREICLVGVWNATASAPSKIVQGLGPTYASALAGGHAAAGVVQDLIWKHGVDAPLISKWTTSISRSISPDSSVVPVVDSINLQLFHAHGTEVHDYPDISNARLQIATQLCGNCHEQQLSVWERSPHSRALFTLISKRKQTDIRCLTCHVSVAEMKPSGNLLGVFCNACHRRAEDGSSNASRELELRCRECHTSMSDPDGKWKAHVKDVCVSGGIAPGQCNRMKLPAFIGGGE